MQRTQWKNQGFGGVTLLPSTGGDTFVLPDFTGASLASGLDVGALVDPPAPPLGLDELIAASDARAAGLQDVDFLTALQSKFKAIAPAGAGLPLAIAGVGLLALLLTPATTRRR